MEAAHWPGLKREYQDVFIDVHVIVLTHTATERVILSCFCKARLSASNATK